ncbi:MAG: phosphate ABC transporter permease subunit PstC [Actinomycetota bacterium]|nr:phosphate ABC transporter permease subunit PstC [Actinomycetota bacterium]
MTTTPIDIAALQGSPQRRRRESLIFRGFQLAAAVSILISAGIVFSLLGEAIVFLSKADLSQLLAGGWYPRRGQFGIATIVAGTMVVTVVGMLVAAPLGLAAAIYLSEYAKPRLRRRVKPILEILAGIPSVVIGFFALTWISPEVIQRMFSDASAFNMAAAGLGVGILVTPLVASIAEDALRSVPQTLREGAVGMGARKRTTTLQIVLPAAVSGIVAAFIIGMSRAIGETMVVAIAAGGTGGSAFTVDPTGPGQTMTAAMTALAVGSDQVRGTDGTFQSLFFVGLLLFFITLTLNILSERFVRRVRQRY